jgi:hypothetical protein
MENLAFIDIAGKSLLRWLAPREDHQMSPTVCASKLCGLNYYNLILGCV